MSSRTWPEWAKRGTLRQPAVAPAFTGRISLLQIQALVCASVDAFATSDASPARTAGALGMTSLEFRVVSRSHEMQRDIRFIADHPAVVAGRDIEEVAGLHFNNPAVIHGGGGASGNNHADVLD